MSRTPADRFAAKYFEEPNSGCWLWTAGTNARGYGQFALRGRSCGAHRASWELHRGPIPDGSCVLHRCDTPPCVNPDHLFLGTHADNAADMMEKGRSSRGERHYNSRLTAEQVAAIRRQAAEGATLTEMAIDTGVRRQTISLVARRKTWTHL